MTLIAIKPKFLNSSVVRCEIIYYMQCNRKSDVNWAIVVDISMVDTITSIDTSVKIKSFVHRGNVVSNG